MDVLDSSLPSESTSLDKHANPVRFEAVARKAGSRPFSPEPNSADWNKAIGL